MSPVVTVDALTKTFDTGFLGAIPIAGRLFSGLGVKHIAQRVEAVRDLTFSVEPGEIFGFLGPNGAGKTTTMKMLMGLIHPTSGSGTMLGEPLGSRRARYKVGFLPEHPYFYDYLKPIEFLDFYARLFSMNARDRKKRSEALLDRVGLNYARDRPLRKFSKGMIQRMGVAQALLNDPDLVVFDEPMSGLDPMGRKDVRDIIFELRERGKTVFFSSPILQDVELVCDRVAIVAKGKLLQIGVLEAMLDEGAHGEVDVAIRGGDEDLLSKLTALSISSRGFGDQHRFTVASHAELPKLVAAVLEGGADLVSVVPHRRSLEELFVEMAGEA
jgi:ABC-2 type transport system ATP-binding protein